MSVSKSSNDEDFNQYAPGHMLVPDFKALAQDIQNRASHCVGAATAETRHFRKFFGTRVLVVKKVSQRVAAQSTCFEPFIL